MFREAPISFLMRPIRLPQPSFNVSREVSSRDVRDVNEAHTQSSKHSAESVDTRMQSLYRSHRGLVVFGLFSCVNVSAPDLV
jgi:hypothetical protein